MMGTLSTRLKRRLEGSRHRLFASAFHILVDLALTLSQWHVGIEVPHGEYTAVALDQEFVIEIGPGSNVGTLCYLTC